MFSYLRVPDHIAKFNGNCRTTPRLVNYTSRLKENKVDRSSFSMMKPADDLETQTIKLPSNLVDLKKTLKTVQPVIGNMNRDGWEIYEGINFNGDFLKDHSNDLNTVIDKKAFWNGISSTNRKMMILSDVDRVNDVFKKYRSLYNAFDQILNTRLRKIPYLDEVRLDNMALLANIGYVSEQEPHRDYSSVKK